VFDSTLPVTMAQMLHHTAAVTRTARHALVVGDMPWMSYHLSPRQAVKSAGAFIKQGGAQAVKLEGGVNRIPAIRAILDAEIPVMGHLGLTPQSVNKLGGYKLQGKSPHAAKALIDDALALEEAGIFALVLECIPAALAAEVTKQLTIPTIGIGAGADCGGQVLVWHDLLGLTEHPPRFVRRFANLRPLITDALGGFMTAVKDGSFPSEAESYSVPASLKVGKK
jgi:3-methyl-2-oxobutanoate hydroxymethyltransferase